jgi:hypothetical protein
MRRDLQLAELFCYRGRQVMLKSQAPPHSAAPQGAAIQLEAVMRAFFLLMSAIDD